MKKTKIWQIITLMLLLPFNVQADTGNIELNCNKTSVSPGTVITCTIKGNSDGEVSALSSKIAVSSNLSIESVVVDSSWQGTDEANLDLYTEQNKTGTFAIATFTIKASSSVVSGGSETITVGSTKFYDDDYDGYDVAEATQSIKILSTVNTLSSITLSSGTLSPSFNSNTTSYSATVDADKVNISAIKTDSNSTVSGNIGVVNLNYGTNTFKINVTSEAGFIKTYTLSITRPDNRSTTNDITSFEFFDYILDFNKDKTEYSLSVENDVTSLALCFGQSFDGMLCINRDKVASNGDDEIIYINDSEFTTIFVYDDYDCEDNVCSLVTNDGQVISWINEEEEIGWSKLGDLKVGANVFRIDVVAENDDIKSYTFNINRKSEVITEDNTDNNTENNKPSNPNTGSLTLYIVLVIAILSIGLGIYFYNQCQKKQVKNTNEKK